MTSTLIDHRPPSVRKRRSAEQWQVLFEQYEHSGLSQSAFCQQEGLAIATFSKWLARSRGSNVAGPASSAPAAFVEVQRASAEQAPSPSANSSVMIRLELGAGIVLEVSRA